jgi:hypothetical protein
MTKRQALVNLLTEYAEKFNAAGRRFDHNSHTGTAALYWFKYRGIKDLGASEEPHHWGSKYSLGDFSVVLKCVSRGDWCELSIIEVTGNVNEE